MPKKWNYMKELTDSYHPAYSFVKNNAPARFSFQLMDYWRIFFCNSGVMCVWSISQWLNDLYILHPDAQQIVAFFVCLLQHGVDAAVKEMWGKLGGNSISTIKRYERIMTMDEMERQRNMSTSPWSVKENDKILRQEACVCGHQVWWEKRALYQRTNI